MNGARLQVSCVSRDPSQSPSPTSSAYNSQFLCPLSTDSLQSLGSSSDSTMLCGSALGLRFPAPPCQEDPLAQPPAGEPVTPPWLVGQSAPLKLSMRFSPEIYTGNV